MGAVFLTHLNNFSEHRWRRALKEIQEKQGGAWGSLSFITLQRIIFLISCGPTYLGGRLLSVWCWCCPKADLGLRHTQWAGDGGMMATATWLQWTRKRLNLKRMEVIKGDVAATCELWPYSIQGRWMNEETNEAPQSCLEVLISSLS